MVFAECYGREIAKPIQQGLQSNDDILYSCGLTEIVHNGSLMVDDLEDKSLKRRGQPCTYLKYGDDYAINTGTLMYYAPIAKLENFIACPEVRYKLMKIYSEEMVNIHFG